MEHAHFENASSTSIKNTFLSKCQHASFCRDIRKRIVHYTRKKVAKNTKKATKVALNIFRGYLQEKRLREAELLTLKVKLRECMYVKLNYTFFKLLLYTRYP